MTKRLAEGTRVRILPSRGIVQGLHGAEGWVETFEESMTWLPDGSYSEKGVAKIMLDTPYRTGGPIIMPRVTVHESELEVID